MPLSLGPNESAAYRSNLAPPPHLDLITAVGFRAVGAALKFDLFETLTVGPTNVNELAGKLGIDPIGLRQLADLLASLGYLTSEGDTYANSPITERWLLRDAPGSYAPVVALWQDLLFGLWDDLEKTLRHGTPAVRFYPWLAMNPQAHHEFDTMLSGQARWLADEILELVPVSPKATSLLDIGGGHANYTAAFCGAHPNLRATVVDLPAALEAGKRTIAELADRVILTPGDWEDADFGTDHDIVLLFNVLHGNRPEQNARLLTKVAKAMRPGGIAVVLDHLAGMVPPEHAADSASDEAFVHAFSLNLFHTQGGRIYPRTDLDAWLEDAGFTTPTWTALRKLPSLHLAVATLSAPGR